MNIFIYEDKVWENLQPLSLTRPVWEIRCGITTLIEKFRFLFPDAQFNFICRDYMVPMNKKKYPQAKFNEVLKGETMFVNGRSILGTPSSIPDYDDGVTCFAGEEIVCAVVKHPERMAPEKFSFDRISETLRKFPKMPSDAKILDYIWEAVENNSSEIAKDVKHIKGIRKINSHDYKDFGVFIVEGKGIYVADKISLAPGVVLDASEGPIFLGEQVKIMPNAVIMGPAAIGKGSLVKIGAKIYGGTSIGPFCKVGGEIEGTIIQGYSNKQHEGFLGHAYIGEWCNIGAGTENSDLKNNYTQVKVQIGDKRVNSGKLKVGLFMGDHCKTGINTTFNTGSVMGVASMAFGAGFQPQYIPSFHWSDGGKLKKADLDSTIETSKVVMSRRGIEISAEEIEILRYIYKNSGQIY